MRVCGPGAAVETTPGPHQQRLGWRLFGDHLHSVDLVRLNELARGLPDPGGQ